MKVFVLFMRKIQKPTSQLFLLHHAMSHFQNYTIISCYSYYGIQKWGWRNVPPHCFSKVVLVSSLQSS